MNSATAPIPPLALVALTAGVLFAHAVVVQQTVVALEPAAPAMQRVLVTRTVLLPAPAMATPAPLPAPLRETPPQRKPAPVSAQAPPVAPVALAASAPLAESPLAQAAAPVTEPASTVAPAPADAESAAQTPTTPWNPPLVVAPEVVATTTAERPEPANPAMAAAPEPRVYVVPGSTRLKFDATGLRGSLQYHARGELAWLHDGASYEARLQLSAFLVGSRVLSSTGVLTAQGLAPKRFGDKFRSETAAHFERDRGRVVFSANTPEAVLLPGAQDQLSIFVQLASMLAGEPGRYPPGTAISMQTVGTRAAEPWSFTVDSAETLSLPGGEQQTLRLTRLPRRDFDQKVEIWLAPALGYLPARIKITQSNGDYIDQQWRSTATP